MITVSVPPPPATLAFLEAAEWFHLDFTASTRAAQTLAASLTPAIVTHEQEHQGRKNARRDVQGFTASVSGIIGAVLRAWLCEQPRPVYRPLQAPQFTGQPISRRDFATITTALIALGYLHQSDARTGYIEWDASTKSRVGLVTRFWPTDALVAIAANHGVTSSSARNAYRQDHSRALVRPSDPVTVSSLKEGFAARPLPCDTTRDPFRSIAQDVEAMNAFATRFTVSGCVTPRWSRRFTANDMLGGRWWAAGGGYQQLSGHHRLTELTIDGEAVSEVDLSASHLGIMTALLGLSLPASDPYECAGIPRSVVKAWTTATLGNGKPFRHWSDRTKADRPEVLTYKPSAVAAAMVPRFPFLAAPGDAVASSASLLDLAHVGTPAKLLPHRLMAIEANGITLAMRDLRNCGVLALPVHDSLIVRASATDVARDALRDAFASIGIPVRTKIALADSQRPTLSP